MYLATLVRERISENNVWMDVFYVNDDVVDVEQNFRKAVKAFLLTPKGQQTIQDTCEDFNWGDAVVTVPDKIWNQYGLFPVRDQKVKFILVNQDEVLCNDLIKTCDLATHPF